MKEWHEFSVSQPSQKAAHYQHYVAYRHDVHSSYLLHGLIDVTLPHAESATQQKMDSHEITVTATGDFFFGQQRVDESGLQKSIVALLTEDPEAVFVLRADENADFGRVVRAIDIARHAGGAKLIIPTRYEDPRKEQ